MGSPSSVWSDEELSLLQDNPDLAHRVIAEKLGRSIQSVSQKRWKLANPSYSVGGNIRATQQFDERPSGWYEESVGFMLMEYAPAFDAWRHYHRYVEVEETGFRKSALGGIVFLRCRRDAEAL